MGYYEKNLKIIADKQQHLLKALNQISGKNSIGLETSLSRSGKLILRVTLNGRKVYLNSAYDPELEAERWVERHSSNANSVLILCGAGFLYHLKALLKLGHYQKVVCYEPSPAILKSCLQAIDLKELQGDFLLLTGNNYAECAALVNDYLAYWLLDMEWAVLPTYQELFPTAIGAFQNALRESVRIARNNLATANLFGEKWASNGVKNLPTIINSPGVKHFFNQFTGIPAVIVSAGPSLEKNIHLLKGIKERAVIICAGTSIRAMLKFGVRPHLLVAFDGTDYNRGIYSNLDLADICLVYNYRFNHDALSYFSGQKVYMKLDIETFSDFLSFNTGYQFGTVRSGFSVAHPSLDLAVKLGCFPVILIGQDLAYTGDKRYAESQYQYVVDKNKLPAGYFITKDLYGQDIVTDSKLDSFRQLFELMVAEYYQGKKIFNATEGGQPIKGVPNCKLEDLIGKYCGKERDTSGRIDRLYGLGLKKVPRHLSGHLVSEIKSLAGQGIFKMETLIDRVQQLKQICFGGGISPIVSAKALAQITAEYGRLVTDQVWRLFLKDLQDWKIGPNQIAIANLGRVETKEVVDAKLHYWNNIFGETKKYLEYVIRQLADVEGEKSAGREQEPPSLVEIAGTINPGQIGERIRRGGKLNEFRAELEGIINRGNRKASSELLYWYGLVLFRQKEFTKAVLTLEKVQRQNQSDGKVSFLLHRCYRKLGNYTKTRECLGNSLRSGFKPEFCRRMLAKNAYQSKDYVSANNYIIDFQAYLGDKYLYQWMRVDCLRQLQLSTEARNEFKVLAANSGLEQRLRDKLERLLDEKTDSDYGRNYRANETFFEKRAVFADAYDEINLKYCKYLGREYIYNQDSRRVLVAINKPNSDHLQLSTDDTLLICDTDDFSIYHQLSRLFQGSSTETKQLLTYLPIFIIEHQLTNWQLMMQKFDFNRLAELKNIHFLIGVTNGDLEQVFIDDSVPLPNVLYGTGLDKVQKLLERVKEVKEKEYQRRLALLQEYYHQARPGRPNKVLIVTSIKEELLYKYGKALQLNLKEHGLETELDCESPPYYRSNKYVDLGLLERFQPDLVIHLFAVAEELETYGQLDLPFISWRMVDRWLTPNTVSNKAMEKILISGDPRVNSSLNGRGFHPEQIKPVLLPYLPVAAPKVSPPVTKNEVAIVQDITDHERVLQAITVSAMKVLANRRDFSGEEIITICRSIFFNLMTGLLKQSSLAPGKKFYEEIVGTEFKGRLEDGQLPIIAGLYQRELEDSFLTVAQAKWLLNYDSDLTVKLYGLGWENDLNLKTHQGAPLKLSDEEYQRVVLQSKINLYPSLKLKNDSYLQPDLINGIAMGGFYLVNGSLIETVGEEVLGPFDGLLETYRNREELLEKVAYFLENETLRREKAHRLQAHVLKNFSISRVTEGIFEAYREMGN